MPVIIVAAVAAAGAAASAAAKAHAESKALEEQKKGIQAQKDIDIEKEKGLAADQDKQHYIDTQKFFREQDPQLAAARDQAIANLNASLTTGAAQQDKVFNQAVQEGMAVSPQDTLAQDLVARAKANLDLGATLPATFQAELVRSGLEQAGATGVGAGRAGPVSQRLGTLLGSAGLALEAQRQAQAGQAATLAAQLKQQRQNILQGLTTTSTNTQLARTNMGTATAGLAQALTPNVGLSGRDVVNMDLTNLIANNQKLMQLANLSAAGKISQGQATQAYIGAGTQFATTMAGGLGGGTTPTGGTMGTAGAGGGGNTANLLNILGYLNQGQNQGASAMTPQQSGYGYGAV